MIILVGLALLGLTLYMSTLAYALRDYSRARLAEQLPEHKQEPWLNWLEAHESELPVLVGVVRVAGILSTLIATVLWFFGESAQIPLAVDQLMSPVLVALALLVIFAVGVPHALAMHAAERFLFRNLVVIRALRTALWPVGRLMSGIEFVVRRLLGIAEISAEEESERAEQEILEAVTEGQLYGAVDEEQHEMIRSIFELHETTVSAIMTPRTEIVALPIDATRAQANDLIRKAGHSRIPVYQDTIDQVQGVLYAKDLIGLTDTEPFDVNGLMRDVPFVPEAKTIDELLRELKQSKIHIAIVLDEYGGTAGLVTIEDIIEELVGEIDDEYDPEAEPPIRHIDEQTLDVDARVHVAEVNEELDLKIPENGAYETIGGFVFSVLGKIPSAGEEFRHENIHVHVLDAEPRKIKRLRVRVEKELANER